MGRPSTYTPEIAAEILERLAAGESLMQVCSAENMPSEALVRKWAIHNAEFGANYARSRDIGIDCMADRLLKVAADAQRDPQCRRVEIDALKWYLCKLAPKRYGDRLELAGDKDNPIQQRVEVVFVPSKKAGE
jgi:hypothetical protein